MVASILALLAPSLIYLEQIVERTPASAGKSLGMDLAFLGKIEKGRLMFSSLEGDAKSFGLSEGDEIPMEGAFCERMLDGRIDNTVPVAEDDGQVVNLDVTQATGIGSYVGVPLRFSDDRLYGTACCMSHSPDPSLRERDVQFMRVLDRLIAEQLEREELEERNRRLENKTAGQGALLTGLEARDGYTGEHSRAVVGVAVARRLGLVEEVEEVEQAALLHDIGKMRIPDSILRKPGPLDEEERELMLEHPGIGERIVGSVEGLSHLAPVIRAEHERWDDKGYPDGLSGEEIPLASRIAFSCDAFHAMTSDRPYQKAMGVPAALAELESNAGTQFCPRAVRALLEVVVGAP
jgi:response regulator RpfG family c-di-GMP phosphodiesterase